MKSSIWLRWGLGNKDQCTCVQSITNIVGLSFFFPSSFFRVIYSITYNSLKIHFRITHTHDWPNRFREPEKSGSFSLVFLLLFDRWKVFPPLKVNNSLLTDDVFPIHLRLCETSHLQLPSFKAVFFMVSMVTIFEPIDSFCYFSIFGSIFYGWEHILINNIENNPKAIFR